MQIILVRHGKTRIEPSRISARDLARWAEAYNRAGIDPALPPPSSVRKLSAAAAYALSSDLPRAIESLQVLDPGRSAPGERVFREADLPKMPATRVRLDPQIWAALAHVGWFLGWPGTTEGISGARRRARAARQRLSALATEHGSVLLVGHGIFNTLIAWDLLAAGWRGPIWPSGTYWSAAVYRKG
jgi:broad specificity phosphatase PhoE